MENYCIAKFLKSCKLPILAVEPILYITWITVYKQYVQINECMWIIAL